MTKTWNKLHYYNPGHETVVLKGMPFYTHSANVRKLQKDLCFLPAWYADPGDYLFVEEMIPPSFFSTLPPGMRPSVTVLSRDNIKELAEALPKMEAMPWGLSPQSIRLYHELKEKYNLPIEIPDWDSRYLRLTGRQTAAECFDKIKACLPDMEMPQTPLFFSTFPDIKVYLSSLSGRFIIKTPYSSSGRGLLWLDGGHIRDTEKNWIQGALNKQGSVSIEAALAKHTDFALEYYSDGKGNIAYQGISLFETNNRGAYTGNFLMNESESRSLITHLIGEEKFQRVNKAVIAVLQQLYVPYKGYLGVDMLIYETENGSLNLHPCIEINMRYTMGMAVLKLFERHVHPESRGVFRILYEGPERAVNQHQRMEQAFPRVIKDGKLKEGYLSLCPITKETCYRAFIIVAERVNPV